MIRNPLLLAAFQRRGYQTNQSLRFRASNSAFLSRTSVASPTNARRWTVSLWVKRGALNINGLLLAGVSGSIGFQFGYSAQSSLSAGDFLTWYWNNLGGWPFNSSAQFRDPNAWANYVIVYDSANATAADRLIVYVNGVRITDITAGITLNQDSAWNFGSGTQEIGRYWNSPSGPFFDGYLAEVISVDGQALTPSSFGQTDPATNQWVPKAYTGTYGANGFYLPFNDATSTTTISQDRSGNGNNWTTSGISVTAGVTFDQMTDTPTNNFATLNNIVASAANISWANLRSGTTAVRGTIDALLINSYWEVTAAGSNVTAGVISGTGTTNTTTVTANKVFGFRLTTAGALDFINITDAGSWTSITTGLTGQQFPYGTTAQADWNFGQRAFVGTVPATYFALNTANLPTPTIQRGDDAFQATLRTGTGATASVSSLRFQPDLVWIKRRDSAGTHVLTDAVRGSNSQLFSNQAVAEETQSNALTAFNSNGYSLGNNNSGTLTQNNVNFNTATYVDWAWREGAAYGFDIVTYAGDNTSNRNISHANGVAPHFAIVKSRSSSNWWAWHRNLSGNTSFLNLNGTGAQTTTNTPWGTGNWSSSQFMVTNNATENANASSTNYVAYLWTSIPGFSLFGSYTGNGSSDGPFVWFGFRPRWVMVKRVDTTGDWYVWDAARNTFNVVNLELLANTSGVEVTATDLDITAGGFKFRNTTAGFNASGGTFVFAAFAENPFRSSNAR